MADQTPEGPRFAFGKNWQRYLRVIDERRMGLAESYLREMLEAQDLRGKTFLDVGCGSGLYSLAARRLGAKVHAFDYDPDSVACARELKRLLRPDDEGWTIEQGDVLDARYMGSLGKFDVVHAWGVLHHTGDMRRAMENAAVPVEPKGGELFLALYNDLGDSSRRWKRIKRFYCSGLFGRTVVYTFSIPYFGLTCLLEDLLSLRNPLLRYSGTRRGMSIVFDCFDWIGGYPYEVSKPEEVFRFCRDRGFSLKNLVTAGPTLYNNQYVFRKGVSGQSE